MKVNTNIRNLGYLGLLIFLFFTGQVKSQAFQVDSSNIEVRSFDGAHVNKFQSQRAYNYDKDPKYEQNPLMKLWYSFWDKLKQMIGRDNLDLTWNILKFLVMILGLGILIQFLLRSTKTSAFKKSDKSPDPKDFSITGNDAKENLASFLELAEKDGKYPLAIRYLFLNCLRILDQEKMIIWRDYKTNEDFSKEISNHEVSDSFNEICRIFEFAVYGEFEIKETKYLKYKEKFESFVEHVKLERV